ncbi:MAG: hypothetical protein HC904_14220 [Blastochloris sp.]|nr:hypothetical protein [Blastochloris sp.]
MVVITIIAILTGLTLGAAKFVQDKAARARAQGEVSALELALERYKIDNGDYPNVAEITTEAADGYSGLVATTDKSDYEGANVSMNQDGVISSGSGGRLLFAELMGRTQLTGTSGTKGVDLIANNRTQYIELKQNQVNKATSNNFIKDPWGFAYGYFYDADGGVTGASNTNAKSLFNEVVPDLWSTAGETKKATVTGSDADEKARYLRWIANWANK